jgi:uncharacterized protein YcfJ
MKKIISTSLMLIMFALTPVITTPAAASLPSTGYGAKFVDYTAEFSEFAPCPRGTFRVRRNTRTKKKLVNSLLAGGVGTLIGAGIGGKRGALLGAGSGAGGYLVYRYVRDRRGRCVPRRVG